jgi:hypothetical protein
VAFRTRTAAILCAKISVAQSQPFSVTRHLPARPQLLLSRQTSSIKYSLISTTFVLSLTDSCWPFIVNMAPAIPPSSLAKLARRAFVTTAPALASHHFERRGLSVNHTQGVTIGVICAYVVGIALLWNLPYVRWVLWPFKVSFIFQPDDQVI